MKLHDADFASLLHVPPWPDSKARVIFVGPPRVLESAAQFPHKKKAEPAYWAVFGGEVERRTRCEPGVERRSSVDDLADHLIGLHDQGNFGRPISTPAVRTQIGQDLVQN